MTAQSIIEDSQQQGQQRHLSRLNIWFTAIKQGLQRWRERRFLRSLDDSALKDIGLSRYDAEREAAKQWRP